MFQTVAELAQTQYFLYVFANNRLNLKATIAIGPRVCFLLVIILEYFLENF